MDTGRNDKGTQDQQKDSYRDNAAFLNNGQDGSAATKSNLVEVPSITLPKGGGAIKGIDEKFSVNAANGTASYSIPLPATKGRKGFTPAVALNYNSGSGNGIFGIGWQLDLPSIQRKTDKRLPEYKDDVESDVFVFSGVEDLVPELVKDEHGNWNANSVTSNGVTVTRYRPRIEGSFSRVEKINDHGNVYWRVRTKDNVVSVFGLSADAKLNNPAPGEAYKIFKWCLEYSYDDKGSFTRFYYKKENLQNVAGAPFEVNRQNSLAPFTNIYLKGIQYSNTTPYYEGDALPDKFLFELVLDYGEHNANKPTVAEDNDWTARTDAFSDYKAGFEIRTYRLCKRVLMFHHFPDKLGMNDYLVRSLGFEYDEQPAITYLEKAALTGFIWNDDGTLSSQQSFPPVEFTYVKPGFSREVKEITPDNLVNAPSGVDGSNYQWTDLYSEGIPGILSEQGSGWFFKENKGNGAFGAATQVSPKPALTGLSNDGTLSIQDLEADGTKFLVSTGSVLKGYFELNTNSDWQPFTSFNRYPNINLKDPNLKFIDLDGDGRPDLLFSNEQHFVWYASKGKLGYDDYRLAAKAMDDERGPAILFANHDEKMLIAAADMTGDGLHDIVLITPAQVCYYPNLGYGQFGAKVTMTMEGAFDAFDHFNPRYIHLADIDGSGTTDIIYVGNASLGVWFNQSGNSLSTPAEFFNPFPEMDDHSNLSVTDLLGNGTSCIVWSSPLPQHSQAPLRYIDLMQGRKPHILIGHKNNLGKEVMLEYTSSTQFYLNDKTAGNPWLTKLPFPVQCVSKVTVQDKVSQTRLANEYTYHHGYYDALEREFRGFALVVQKDTEEFDHYVQQTTGAGALNTVEQDLYQPAVITKTWFHTGAYLGRDQWLYQLQDEFYPNALVKSGKITDAEVIATLQTYRLSEAPLPTDLTTNEYVECCRALKGLMLRQETYSDEGTAQQQLHPYTVTQHNYDVQLLQPRQQQRFAVFLTHEKETLGFNYERNPLDPRITHSINVDIDPHGNVLEAASIVYGRKHADAGLPTDDDRKKQTNGHITYAQNLFTDIIDIPTAYRLPVLYESENWELNTGAPAAAFFTSIEIQTRFTGATVVLYEQDAALNEKRKIEHSRTLFLKNDLTAPMALGNMDTLALPYVSYLLAFTPSLLQTIYGAKWNDALLKNEGRYVNSEGDNNYWVPSGRTYFHPDLSGTPNAASIPAPTPADITFAKNNFYAPVAYEDNFGKLTKVFYDSDKLFIQRTIDAVGNEAHLDAFNYRIGAPYLVRDLNNNRQAVRFDALGQVTHTFVMGKATEFKGDKFDDAQVELSVNDQPGSLLEYDFRYYTSNGLLPNRVKTSLREYHYYQHLQPGDITGGPAAWLTALLNNTLDNTAHTEPVVKWQHSYSYTNGSAKEVLRKIQAEPGLAPQRDAQGKLVLDAQGKVQLADTSPAIRWTGSGRTIYNNKGNAVKQYEPFFDSTPEYNREEELVLLGFTSVTYYDALSRVIKIKHANGTFNKVEFDTWMQVKYDENDTVQDSDWYTRRIGGGLGPNEQAVAQQTALHYNTPLVVHLDSLGRPFLSIAHNKTQRSGEGVLEEFYRTRTDLDIEGNARRITDARDNSVMNWKYNMLGKLSYQQSMDAGERFILTDAMGKPLRVWDSRHQTFSYTYDDLHRPLQKLVDDGSGNQVYEQYEYGDSLSDAALRNCKGKLYKLYDTAGILVTEAFDFKSNVYVTTRQLVNNYKELPNWNANPGMENEVFHSGTAYDALNRPRQVISPDSSVFIPQFNEANFLNRVDVKIKGAAAATNFVSNINYNPKGQREQIYYGNNTTTHYDYEPETCRLTRLLTTANGGATILQDLNYLYDPVGNIAQQFDNAQKTVFYGGQQVAAQSHYIYDAVYRLIEGEGREHIGQAGSPAADNWNDNWCRLSLQPGSPLQLRNYTQKYFYDAVGNLLTLLHTAGVGSYTRNYKYNAGNNQLTQTDTGGPVYAYTYNEHGSMIALPQLSAPITWNCREEMQQASLGGGGTAFYMYDCKGQRVRKVIEKTGGLKEERIYLGQFEIYRESQNGNVTLERETLHVMDDQQRIAMIDTKTKGNDGTVPQLIRYQYGNHLGTACLELDDAAKIISYEEFHPFGTTAYQATDNSRQVPAKRYRYTGMERDEETGLNYHTARYYMPWLGRWTAADPIGIGDGVNIYAYVSNNPIRSKDATGTQDGPTQQPVQITHPQTSDPQPRFPEAGVPNPQPDGIPRAIPPPGHGAEVNGDVATPDFHLAGRTSFHIIIGQPGADDPSRSPLHLHGDFRLRYPGMPSAVPLDPRIEGNIAFNGSTISSAALPPLPDPSVALSNFAGHYKLTGNLRGVPLVTGRFSLTGDVQGGDGPTKLTFDARVGVIADTPILPFVRFTGTGTAVGDSLTASGSFHGWGPGITWGNWNYSRQSGLDITGNYIGLQFGPLGLGSLDLHPEVPTSPDDPAPNLPPPGGGLLAGHGVVDVFNPGTSVGFTRFQVNPNTQRYLLFSAGVSLNPSIEHQDVSRPSPWILDLPGMDHVQDLLNYHPNVGEGTPVPWYFGVSFSGTLP